MEPVFVGIDVAFAKRKCLPVSVCVLRDERLTPLPLKRGPLVPPRGRGNVAALDESVVREFAREAARYLQQVAEIHYLEIVRIAIDAPKSSRRDGSPRRASEAAMDEARISCITTPSEGDFAVIKTKVEAHLAAGGSQSRLPHANQLWMLAGFALFRELAGLAECIEVYPQATVRALGVAERHKSNREGLDAQITAAAGATGWPTPELLSCVLEESGRGSMHDKLDAYLSAWVASLDEDSRLAHGEPPDDVIWVPDLPSGGDDPVALEAMSDLVRPALPAPIHEETLENGRVRLIGGDPGEVVAVLSPSSLKVSEFAVEWQSQTPVVTPVLVGEIIWNASRDPEQRLTKLIAKARSRRRRKYRTCELCGKRQPPEWMHDGSVCQGCAVEHWGVVY